MLLCLLSTPGPTATVPVEELFELLHFLWAKIIEYFLPTLVEQGKTNPTHPLLNQPVQSMSNLDFEKVNQIRDKGNDAFGKNDYTKPSHATQLP